MYSAESTVRFLWGALQPGWCWQREKAFSLYNQAREPQGSHWVVIPESDSRTSPCCKWHPSIYALQRDFKHNCISAWLWEAFILRTANKAKCNQDKSGACLPVKLALRPVHLEEHKKMTNDTAFWHGLLSLKTPRSVCKEKIQAPFGNCQAAYTRHICYTQTHTCTHRALFSN